MSVSTRLGLVLLLPAFLMVVTFFLVPVALTAVFAFTNMSTATGITGGAWLIAPNAVRRLEAVVPDLADDLTTVRYVIDEAGLTALAAADVDPAIIAELRATNLDQSFATRRDVERVIRDLQARPATRTVKLISERFSRSVVNTRFADKASFFTALDALDLDLTADQKAAIATASYTGWTWTTANFVQMVASPNTFKILFNTALYVSVVLILFNTTYAMMLAIATHYLPDRQGSVFRAIWLLPRITPPVIYVLMWKWLAWDTGFLSMFLEPFGVTPRNWLLDSGTNAWIFVVLINGFVGASMGMLVFSSALRAIPQSQFHASEVDGANRWQQVRYIIMPQMRWPILFITCYQTLSLLASFELILLATDGGPGGATEVWSLAAYHTALNNYAGNLQYGYGTAMALVLVVIGIVLALIYLRIFNYQSLVAKPLIEQ